MSVWVRSRRGLAAVVAWHISVPFAAPSSLLRPYGAFVAPVFVGYHDDVSMLPVFLTQGFFFAGNGCTFPGGQESHFRALLLVPRRAPVDLFETTRNPTSCMSVAVSSRTTVLFPERLNFTKGFVRKHFSVEGRLLFRRCWLCPAVLTSRSQSC